MQDLPGSDLFLQNDRETALAKCRTLNAKIADFPPSVSPTSFSVTTSFLRQTVGQDFYFYLIVALLEYSVVLALCIRASTPVIPIERNVNVPQP